MNTRYILVLGSKNISSWSLRPWLAMKMANIAFDEALIALRLTDTVARIQAYSDASKVPVLKIEENGKTQTVWDSLAICETLAERHPAAHLWPEDAGRRAEARSIAAEMHAGFPDVRKNLSMDIARRLPTPELDAATEAQVARIIGMWEGALRRYASEGGFLFGRFSIADCFYAPVATRFETYGIALPAASDAYARRILALPAMQEWTACAKAEIG